jgi:hypothetical protein
LDLLKGLLASEDTPVLFLPEVSFTTEPFPELWLLHNAAAIDCGDKFEHSGESHLPISLTDIPDRSLNFKSTFELCKKAGLSSFLDTCLTSNGNFICFVTLDGDTGAELPDRVGRFTGLSFGVFEHERVCIPSD